MADNQINTDLEENNSERDISAGRVIRAIEEDKLCLFCQVIKPVKQSVNMCVHP